VHRILTPLCHAVVLVAAFRWTHSTSGLLVTGLGLIVLMNRLAPRLLPGSAPVAWKKELCVGASYFLGGGVCFYLMRPGIVPLWEAAYRGVIVFLVALLLEEIVTRAGRVRSGRWANFRLRGMLLAVVVALVPVIAALHPLHTVPTRTPSAFGLTFEDVRFRTADDVELAGWFVPHPRPRANVIFCHGHGRNRGHVGGLLPTFHDLGLNVLAFDFRGHGDSEGHTSTFGSREVQDLRAAAEYLNAKCPGQPLLLVGVSLGAAVCLQTVPDLPEVRGVWSEGAFARLGNAVDNEFAPLPGLLRGPVIGGYYLAGWLDCGFWAPSVNPIDRLSRTDVPIFFCHGEKDELVPVAEGQALCESYAGPKDHWWVAGASHYDVRQRNKTEYLGRLRVFMEACLSRCAGLTGDEARWSPRPFPVVAAVATACTR
jgi:alpha-beta hydrolase superfamily lysophospholipase